MTTLATVTAYIRAVERHAPIAEIEAFLHPDVLVVEHPNKITPAGGRYDRAALAAANERGKALLARETYEIRDAIVDDDRAALRIVWTGVVAANGAEIRAQICSVFELREGRIWRQEQYDCFH